MVDDIVRKAIELISADVARTLGRNHAVSAEIGNRAALLPEFTDPNELAMRLAEDIQEYVHDVYIDTVWPACPIHPEHPLWLVEDEPQHWWTCTETGTRIAALGELGSTQTS